MASLGLWSTTMLVLATAACSTSASAPNAPAPPATWADVAALPKPPAGLRIADGAGPKQFGDLRLPSGRGPHPVAILLHGGCWQGAYNLDYLAPLADRLARNGIASWSLEYRGIGDAGGGWPGTFEDVAAGAAQLRALAGQHALDLDRVALAGHSAGGHLALWLAAPPATKGEPAPLASSTPRLKVRGVIGLAAIADLHDYGRGTGDCNQAVAALLGGTPAQVPGRYAAASPGDLLPLGVPLRLFNGSLDPIVTAAHAQGFVTKARARGDEVEYVALEGAGHFDLVMPDAPASRRVQEALRRMLERP